MESLERERWTSAGVAAVHAAIALADAVLVQERGIRSTSSDHLDVVELLGQELPDLPGVDGAQKHLRHILSQKNRVEYEARVFTRKDAEAIVTHLSRFAEWVNTVARSA